MVRSGRYGTVNTGNLNVVALPVQEVGRTMEKTLSTTEYSS